MQGTVPRRFQDVANALAGDYRATRLHVLSIDLSAATDGLEAVVSRDGSEAGRLYIPMATSVDAELLLASDLQDFLGDLDRELWPMCPEDGQPFKIVRDSNALYWSCDKHDTKIEIGQIAV